MQSTVKLLLWCCKSTAALLPDQRCGDITVKHPVSKVLNKLISALLLIELL